MKRYGKMNGGLKRDDPAYFLTWKNRRRDRRQYHLRNYMQRVGCVKCGYNEDWKALIWDHVEPLRDTKALRMPYYISCSSLKRLGKELRKCQVLCANCHMIKTKEEGGHSGVK